MQRNYSAEIDCPTILHEVLHQLGLSDEYNEIDDHHKEMPETGIISRILQNIEYAIFGAAPPPEHDCRFVSENSIMGDYYNRWDSIFEDKAETSLLSPRHFDFILYGECQRKISCTMNAQSKLIHILVTIHLVWRKKKNVKIVIIKMIIIFSKKVIPAKAGIHL